MAQLEFDSEWRKKEESLEEIIKKYPELPPIAILEIDAHRRGVFYTDKALERLDESVHQVTEYTLRDKTQRKVPASLTLRDGSHLVVGEDFIPGSLPCGCRGRKDRSDRPGKGI